MTWFKIDIVNFRFFFYKRHTTLIDINQNKGCFLCCSKSCGQLITDLLIKLQDLCPFPALFLFSIPDLILPSFCPLPETSFCALPVLFLHSSCPLYILFMSSTVLFRTSSCPLTVLFLSSPVLFWTSSWPLPVLLLSSSCHFPVLFLTYSYVLPVLFMSSSCPLPILISKQRQINKFLCSPPPFLP